jgi:hypothetical protein
MRVRYLYLYVSGSLTITMYYKNRNPNVIRSSMHARVLLFLPAVAFLVHSFLPKISFLSTLTCFQHAPNIDMWLVPSHLTSMCFFDLPGDHLELLHEFRCVRLGLRGILLESIQYLYYNLIVDQPCTFFLGLCHICLGFLFL